MNISLNLQHGTEESASVVQEITNLWPGLVIIHGAPRRPQTQGCVERGNGDLQLKLGKWLDQHGGTWSTALQLVTHAINTSTAAATGKTPYEVVFGQLPRRDFFILEQLSNQTNGPLLEENIDRTLIEQDEEGEDDETTNNEETQTTVEEEEPTQLEQAPVPSTSNDQQRGWGTPPRLEEDHDDDNILINLDVEPNQVDTLLDQLGNGGATGHDDQQLDETPTTNTIITPVTPKNSKRGHNYFLLHSEDHNNIIATGTEVRNRTTLHGTSVNIATHAVIEVIEVCDMAYIPTSNNPHEEPLSIGQFISWPLVDLLENTETDTPHAKVRREARTNYLQTAHQQNILHQNLTRSQQKDLNVSDNVGIKINNVDRTNTEAKFLPCKILEKKPLANSPYKLYSATGIIKTRFQSQDLIEMKSVHFPSLETVDPTQLPEITLIQASRDNTKWKTPAPDGSRCSCKGSCITNKCRCKKAGLKCSTKCHPSNQCQNKF